jgi:hypothetical protein
MSKPDRISAVLFIVLLGGAAVSYLIWNKPHRRVESEMGIEITASQLIKEYQENEAVANERYLDKAIQVIGKASEVESNQDGKTTVTLSTEDPFANVFCTLKSQENIATGTHIVIKGICSGMLSDVRLRDAVVVR